MAFIQTRIGVSWSLGTNFLSLQNWQNSLNYWDEVITIWDLTRYLLLYTNRTKHWTGDLKKVPWKWGTCWVFFPRSNKSITSWFQWLPIIRTNRDFRTEDAAGSPVLNSIMQLMQSFHGHGSVRNAHIFPSPDKTTEQKELAPNHSTRYRQR